MLISVSIYPLFKYICIVMPQMLIQTCVFCRPPTDKVRIKIDPVLQQHYSPMCVSHSYM